MNGFLGGLANDGSKVWIQKVIDIFFDHGGHGSGEALPDGAVK